MPKSRSWLLGLKEKIEKGGLGELSKEEYEEMQKIIFERIWNMVEVDAWSRFVFCTKIGFKLSRPGFQVYHFIVDGIENMEDLIRYTIGDEKWESLSAERMSAEENILTTLLEAKQMIYEERGIEKEARLTPRETKLALEFVREISKIEESKSIDVKTED